MKKIISIIQIVLILGCVLLPATSCSDFLTKEPPATGFGYTMENKSGVESLLTGAYALLRGTGDFGGAMGTDWTYGSGASDDTYKGTDAGDQTNFNYVERYEALPTNAYMSDRWRDCYMGVARTNLVLKFLKATQAGSDPIEAGRATVIEAETKYLRAWYHFSANRVFEKIPYIMTTDEMGGKEEGEIPNTDAGWSGIETDLKYAINNLPESFSSEPGRVTKFAAMTLLAQVYMYQSKFSEAKPLLDQVLNSGKYALVANYNDNYDEDTENNSESIFEIQCATSPVNNTSMLIAGRVFIQPTGPAGFGWGFHQPSQCLVDAFQVDNNGLPYLDINTRPTFKNDMGVAPNDPFTPSDEPVDPRLDWTVARRGIDYNGWGIFPGRSWIRDQGNGGPYMTKKYLHFERNRNNQNGNGFSNSRNYRYHRLAHVILWRAEVAIEDGELEMARELVNQIRNRAKNTQVVMGLCTDLSIPSTGIAANVDWTKPAANYKAEPYPAGHDAFSSKEKARVAVRHEIRLEFATEGQRFFDLRRWDIDEEVLPDYIRRDSEFRSFMRGAVYTKAKRYWPIPQSQMDLQRGVLTQNPNY